MKFESKDYTSYTINLAKLNKFKTIDLYLIIREPIKKEEITIRKILFAVLTHNSKKYYNPKDITIKLEDLYSARIFDSTYRDGRFINTEIFLSGLEDKYTEENNYERIIELLSEILFNPKVENDSFDDEIINLYKERLKNNILELKENPKVYASIKSFELHNKSSVTSYRLDGYIEDLDKIDGKSLYKYYKKVLKTNLFDFYVVGNTNFSYISPLIKKYFSKINIISKKNTNILVKDKTLNRLTTYKESLDFEQSILYLFYKFDNIRPNDRFFKAKIASLLLNGPSGLLFSDIREKHSLCYYIGAEYDYFDNILVITAYISKDNKDKVIKLIKDNIKKLTKLKFNEDLLEAKKDSVINFYENYDLSSYRLKNYMYDTYTLNLMNKDEIITNIKKVNKNDIAKITKKLKLETIYYLEGVKNEEE